MRNVFLLFALAIFFTAPAQNVFTVNNMPGTAATHRTLQGAIDSAAAGAIIYLEPSPATYGVVNLNKPVTLIGNGYFLGLNPAPFTQANAATSILTTLNIASGAQGSIITGISFTAPFTSSSVRLSLSGVSNITFARCQFAWEYMWGNYPSLNCAYLENVSGITFRQCYFECPGQGFLAATNTVSNILYENNIMTGNNLHFVQPYGGGLAPGSITYRHNTFYSRQSDINFGGSRYFSNVLLLETNNAITTGAGATAATGNVSNKPVVGAGNITNANLPDVLLLASNPQVLSPDGRMQLKPGSPAIGYGEGGVDAGAFGGSNPYVLSGIPFIPNIYASEVAQTGTSAGGLKLQLKVRANN